MAPADDLPVQDGLIIPGAELAVQVSRASGPGGQHVNTTDTRVQLRWSVADSAVLTEAQRAQLQRKLGSRLSADGILTVACDTHRSQRRNREEARERLAALVREGLRRPRPRRRTSVPRAQRAKRLEDKRRQAAVKRQRKKPRED
jgi:ribosome-associated protein